MSLRVLVGRPVLRDYIHNKESRNEARVEIHKALASVLVSHKVEYSKEELNIWMDDIYQDCAFDSVEFIIQMLGRYRRGVRGYRTFSHVDFIEICGIGRQEVAVEREKQHSERKKDVLGTSIEDVLKGYDRQKKEGKAKINKMEEGKEEHTAITKKAEAHYLGNPEKYKYKD